jgi:hypothetical protein
MRSPNASHTALQLVRPSSSGTSRTFVKPSRWDAAKPIRTQTKKNGNYVAGRLHNCSSSPHTRHGSVVFMWSALTRAPRLTRGADVDIHIAPIDARNRSLAATPVAASESAGPQRRLHHSRHLLSCSEWYTCSEWVAVNPSWVRDKPPSFRRKWLTILQYSILL